MANDAHPRSSGSQTVFHQQEGAGWLAGREAACWVATALLLLLLAIGRAPITDAHIAYSVESLLREAYPIPMALFCLANLVSATAIGDGVASSNI